MKHAEKGRVAKKMPHHLRKKVVRVATEKLGVSQQLLARKFGISKSHVRKILQEAGIKYLKRRKAPQVTEPQTHVQKTRLRNLSRGPMRSSEKLKVFMNDEFYFTYSGSQMSSNAGFYASAGGDAPSHVKFRPESKFPRKLLVWLAMSPKGSLVRRLCPAKTT